MLNTAEGTWALGTRKSRGWCLRRKRGPNHVGIDSHFQILAFTLRCEAIFRAHEGSGMIWFTLWRDDPGCFVENGLQRWRAEAEMALRNNWLLASPGPFRDSFSGYQCQREQITTFLGACMFLLIQREIGSKRFSLSFQLWQYVNHQSPHFYKRQFFPVLDKVLMILKIIL